MEELARAWRGNLVCHWGQLGHTPGMSSTTSHCQFYDVAPRHPAQHPRKGAHDPWPLPPVSSGRAQRDRVTTLTLQPWGTLVPLHGTTQQPKRPENRPGCAIVSPYCLLTYPDEPGVGRSHGSPPGCTSQGIQTVAPQLPCARGDSLEHTPSCCCPRPHPYDKRNQSMTSGSSNDQQAACSTLQLLGCPK